jgi:hypothetical protein
MGGDVPIVFVLATVFLRGTAPHTGSVHACGNTFVVVSPGVQLHRPYAAIYPASIVIYSPSARTAKTLSDPKLLRDLKLAGHQVSLIEDNRALVRVLQREVVDLVLIDVADVNRTSTLAAAASTPPTVLCVVYELTPAQAKALEAECGCRFSTSSGTDHFLKAIDDAMKTRVNRKKKKVS